MDRKKEKKEKVGELKKDQNKKNVIKNNYKQKDLNLNDTKRVIRCGVYIATFFASIFSIIVFVFGIISSFSVASKESGELLHDNFTMVFVSKINNCSIEEVKLSYMAAESRGVYILFNVILPTIALVCAAILIILLCSLILKFIQNVDYNEELFTVKKLKYAESIVNILSVIVFINWILFNNPSIPFTLLIFFLLFVIYYLFKLCVVKKINDK